MEKIILQVASTMVWKTVGIFNDIDSIHTYIKENYDISFEEYKTEILNEEGYEPTLYDWLSEYEFNIIYTKEN